MNFLSKPRLHKESRTNNLMLARGVIIFAIWHTLLMALLFVIFIAGYQRDIIAVSRRGSIYGIDFSDMLFLIEASVGIYGILSIFSNEDGHVFSIWRKLGSILRLYLLLGMCIILCTGLYLVGLITVSEAGQEESAYRCCICNLQEFHAQLDEAGLTKPGSIFPPAKDNLPVYWFYWPSCEGNIHNHRTYSKPSLDYECFTGTLPEDTIPIVWDRKGNHPYGRNVLFSDGRVETFSGYSWNEFAAKYGIKR
ncbi:MAG: hypothetical protein ACYS8W_02290 [Planctomycetota bacterium]|jgi:hypothetical protein